MSEYISKRKIDTNECPNIRDQYIRIFEYIRHTLVGCTPTVTMKLVKQEKLLAWFGRNFANFLRGSLLIVITKALFILTIISCMLC